MKDIDQYSALSAMLMAAVIPDSKLTPTRILKFKNIKIPDEWDERFSAANKACETILDTTLEDVLDSNVVFREGHGAWNGSDPTIIAFYEAGSPLLGHIVESVHNGPVVLEVLNAARFGELRDLFKV